MRTQLFGLAVATLALAAPALADSPSRLQEARAAGQGVVPTDAATCGAKPMTTEEMARYQQGSRSVAARHANVPCFIRPSHHGYADGTPFTRTSPPPWW
jgi:hypothetical protein